MMANKIGDEKRLVSTPPPIYPVAQPPVTSEDDVVAIIQLLLSPSIRREI